jgi:hypothetical protein
MSSESVSDPKPAEAAPWWRFGMVWLVVAGPAIVVVAGLVTAAIAIRGADPVLSTEERAAFQERPAMQGRNHAATAGAQR